MNENRVFLDTNIIVYAYDSSIATKHKISAEILGRLWRARNGLISTQVLQEFFVVTTKKLPKPIPIEKARMIIKDLAHWEIITVDISIILKAIEIHQKHHFSFWDSLIISSAIQGKANVIYSEDLSHNNVICGIKIINPYV